MPHKPNIDKVKWCWVVRETLDGWRLKLVAGKKEFKMKGLLLDSLEDVRIVTTKGNYVAVHLKNSPRKQDLEEKKRLGIK